jgi:hypothetical protein
MKVLNLQCSHLHSFEGWFGSEGDFQDQLARSLIECPLCADKRIQKLPSAPRLNLGVYPAGQAASGNVAKTPASSASAAAPLNNAVSSPSPATPEGLPPTLQADFLKALRHALQHTEDVGQGFADEARRMHYGETEARNIRGQASVRETVELLEEGIEVLPLPMLPVLKETLH